ncbi:glycosyltransferase, partial [Erwinia billingiae]
ANNEIPLGNYSLKKKYGLQDKVVFFYGGNIGTAQDMDNILRLAKKIENHVNAHFLFVGEGDEVPLVLSAINESKAENITYIKSISQEEFKLLLKEIDVGLFTLNKHHKSHNFPGKILGYMVNNVPILGSVNQGNDLEET